MRAKVCLGAAVLIGPRCHFKSVSSCPLESWDTALREECPAETRGFSWVWERLAVIERESSHPSGRSAGAPQLTGEGGV